MKPLSYFRTASAPAASLVLRVWLASIFFAAWPLLAADSIIGTWVRKFDPASHERSELTMTVEACCNDGRRFTYRIKIREAAEFISTIESPMDGTDVPVMMNGKPSGETMGIKKIDSRHSVAVLKFNGKQFGTSKATLSEDFNTLTVESDFTSAEGGRQPGKVTEIWVRK